jgi:protein ImuB
MSRELYLCAFAAEFPAQALLRLRADWQTEAVVVMDGRAPQERVCSMSRPAERKGAAVGMTRLEAESIGGLRLRKRSTECEAAARTVFLECAAKFSPRIEEADDAGADTRADGASRRTEYALVLDITGTERLFGPPQRLAERLRDELAEAGFGASIAVSANYDAARMKAAAIRGIAAIDEGGEAEALAKLPIAALGLNEEHAGTFALWGIGTLGELAALPEAELVARMGSEARRWRALARGAAEHAFVPVEPAFSLEEFCEFEAPVEQIDSLLFVGARMIDCLATRAAGRALALRSLEAEMRVEGGGTHGCAIRPAVPSADRRFLLKLLQLEISAHPPQAAVAALTLRAEAGQTSKVQLGLFTPQTPEPSRLDVTLARLRALVGENRVGSPVLEDTHHAGAFRMEGFTVPGEQVSELAGRQVSVPTLGAKTKTRRGWGTRQVPVEEGPRMALRRVRPARVVRVLVSPTRTTSTPRAATRIARTAFQPVSFRDGEHTYMVAAAYGPWRTSGCWWAMDAWDAEEWDVLAVCVEKRSTGAKAPIHFASDTTPFDSRSGQAMKSCPDTNSQEHPAGANQGSRTNIQFVEEKQPQILRLRPAARGFAQDDKQNTTEVSEGATIACLLIHDRTRNAWRREAFYD